MGPEMGFGVQPGVERAQGADEAARTGSKRIVLCADGTWNTPHGPAEMPNDTNVGILFWGGSMGDFVDSIGAHR